MKSLQLLLDEKRRLICKNGRARGGFTLIELLAVILIIGLLMTFLLPKIPEAIDNARVLACKKNLQEIYKGFLSHDIKYDDIPRESGVRFFASLISRGVWENTESSAKKLTCPGVKLSALAIGDIDDPKEWFNDLDMITPDHSSYAGRDTVNYKMRKFPGSGEEPLVADDNDPEMNHDTTTNVLYADGAVGTFEVFTERERGNIGEDEILIVGPDSPIEALQKLSLD